MSAQDMLALLGVACMVGAVGCAVVALRAYVVLDIRGVRDDLSGRVRQRELAKEAGAEGLAGMAVHPAQTPVVGEDAIATRLA